MSRIKVAERHDLADGEMNEFEAGETKVLLVQLEGTVYALQGQCPHYGASLAEGVLDGARIICPWHHACFSAKTGALLEPPALDALPQFKVDIESDAIWVELPEPAPEAKTPSLPQKSVTDERVFVILGAGAAGMVAAETLREEGFEGRVVLVTSEPNLPYDRTVLSKEYLAEEETKGWVPMRDRVFLETRGLELLTNQTATELDIQKHKITFENGSVLSYDALLLAVGSVPEKLELPGSDLPSIHYLRTLADARELITEAGAGQRTVIVGASFIGMEAAASLRQRGLEVSVVTPGSVPFADLLGSDVGEMIQTLHAENGIEILSQSQVVSFGRKDHLTEVRLENGDTLEADFVLIGTGVSPALAWVNTASKTDDGSLTVDRFLRVSEGNGTLYAAGDIATFPLPLTGEPVRIEHWRLAMQHGRTAARNMLGQALEFSSTPYFWSKLFDLNLRYVGHAPDWDETVVEGDLQKRTALVYYLKQGNLLAVLGIGRDPEVCAVEACMDKKHLPPAADLREGKVDWLKWLDRADY